MNENETSQQKNEQIKEQHEEDYDMSGTIIFSIFERHKYNPNGDQLFRTKFEFKHFIPTITI